MGTWGTGAFENDAAADWAWQIEDAASGLQAVDTISSALRAVLDLPAGEASDADVASCGLAAAEVVAAALGRPSNELPDGVDAWIAIHGEAIPRSLSEIARRAVERVNENSELTELWNESGQSQEWLDGIAGLKARLSRE
jgi:Domain of unknown function (DUF4259)